MKLKLSAWVLVVVIYIYSQAAGAIAYTVTGGPPGTLSTPGPNGETQPPLPNPVLGSNQLSSGDSVTVQTDATMATPSSSSTNYTVGVLSPATSAITVTVDANSTLSYSGTNSGGAAVYVSRSDTTANTTTIDVNGTVSAGTGLYAIYLANSHASPQDMYAITLNSGSTISGAILTNGVDQVTLSLYGSANITGTINLSPSGTLSTSNSIFQIDKSANFTPTEEITNIGFLHVQANNGMPTEASTLTLNVYNTNIYSIDVAAYATFNVNYALSGVSGGNGTLTNNGTMNIAANISHYGAFVYSSTQGSPTTTISGGTTSTPIAISVSSYEIYNHTAILNNILNYGTMNLTSAVPFTVNNSFQVTYPENGYFPGGTYTLVSGASSLAVTTYANPPNPTLFLTFGKPAANGNNIQMTITRTPFTTYATTALTQTIAGNLETLGVNTQNTDMINVLDAVEASTTGSQLEYALQQLSPLISAPLFGFEVQNETMYQVQLRLAELRNGTTHYLAGDINHDTHMWLRPFGTYANQHPKDDSFGYYGTCGGIAAGFDRVLDARYMVGTAFAYALANVEDKVNTQSNTKIKSYIGLVYGTYNFTDVKYLDWVLAVTANNFNAVRYIGINNVYAQTATSSYGSQQVSAKVLGGANYSAFDFMQLTPEISAQYTFAKQYTYDESGAAGANLQISRTNSNIVELGLGGKVSTPIALDPGIVVPEIHGTVFYNPINGKQNTVFSFIEGGGPMVSFLNLSRVGLRIGAALTVAVVDKMEIKANIDYDIEDRYNSYTVYLDLRYML